MAQKTLEQLKNMLKESQELNNFALKEYEEASNYYHSNQLPEDVVAQLKERGQPPQFENIFAMLMDKILGFKSNSKQDIVVQGQQYEDKDLALVLTDIIKSISSTKKYEQERRKSELSLCLGIAISRVWCENLNKKDKLGKNEKIITIDNINPLYFFIDPLSVAMDASDAKYFHQIIFMDKEDAENSLKLKDGLQILKNEYNREIVYFIETWVKNNEKNCVVWDRYIWDNSRIIQYENSPFLNKNHPYVVQKLKVDYKNRFYGFFRNLKPIVDSINFTENRILNMLSSTKVIFENDAVDDADKFSEEINLDNAAVPVKSGGLSKIRVEKQSNEIAQISQKQAEKKNSARIISGFNDEMLGLANNRLSGDAMTQRQNAGIVSLANYIEACTDFEKEIFSKAISLICHYFDAEQVFRIVDKNDFERYFTINEIQKNNNGDFIRDTSGKISIKNKISVGYYDIRLKNIPKTEGKRDERFKAWAEILKTILPIMPELASKILPLVFEDTDNSAYRDIKEIIQNHEQERVQNQNPSAELQQKRALLENQYLEAKINTEKAKALNNVGQANYQMNKQNLMGERTDLR